MGRKKHPPKHLRKLRSPGVEIARKIAILRAGKNLRIKRRRGSRSQMLVSKPSEARRKPKGICRSTHLDVRA